MNACICRPNGLSVALPIQSVQLGGVGRDCAARCLSKIKREACLSKTSGETNPNRIPRAQTSKSKVSKIEKKEKKKKYRPKAGKQKPITKSKTSAKAKQIYWTSVRAKQIYKNKHRHNTLIHKIICTNTDPITQDIKTKTLQINNKSSTYEQTSLQTKTTN